ncbi:hypothetical protein [Glycomyces albidus]|uniref:Uncharacterized protein n=1 Tax=Glycomyces albidus TaxID=2656774 RepID=A0A6L5GAG5_9ACTN|nr:hypothetical protein [Glycomyces albidus]MQM26709.1 hypothetical protein [Glycomyces albidus]
MVHGLAASAAVPRGMLVADAWSQLGDAVAPLSNASGRPLARTVKLLLDPLVLRPTQNPRFSGGVVAIEHVDALRQAILDAGPVLAATAAWFQLLKRARRRAGITEGHPQDLYFQRCYELAHLHGDPAALPGAADIAAAAVADVHAERGDVTVDRLRRFLTDPARTAELAGLLREAWAGRDPVPDALPTLEAEAPQRFPARDTPATHEGGATQRPLLPDTLAVLEAEAPHRLPVQDTPAAHEGEAPHPISARVAPTAPEEKAPHLLPVSDARRPPAQEAASQPAPPETDAHPGIAAFLDDCATAPDPRLWKALADDGTGTAEAARLDLPGIARGYGLTERDRPAVPELGERASKRALPKPFDRSILERLFAALTTWFHRESMADVPSLVTGEIHRSAAPWQLAEEPSRVAMVLGRDASAGLGTGDQPPAASDANARLLNRWRRESYVHRVLRLPDPIGEEVRGTRRAYLRRLWVRLHGRELRGEATAADEVWDLLDGALRSVVMDQRDRLKRSLEREEERS